MPKLRISLANKCQLLFGLAVLLILGAALLVLRYRMNRLVSEGQKQVAQRLSDKISSGGAFNQAGEMIDGSGLNTDSTDQVRRRINDLAYGTDLFHSDENIEKVQVGEQAFQVTVVKGEALQRYTQEDAFVQEALRRFDAYSDLRDYFRSEEVEGGRWRYRLARAVRDSDLERRGGDFSSDLTMTQVVDPVQRVVLIEWEASWPKQHQTLNLIYLLLAGMVAVSLAIVVFWFITTRIILSPVRVLRETAQQVAEGDLNIRADIDTGDEFEELSEAFNNMLTGLKLQQDQLWNLNQQLDSKVSELAEANVALYESSQLKSDFLANVSHELRTPLNSIIGFAELLEESMNESASPKRDRRLRYASNIAQSGKTLLQMINELLDLAKIEAGRIELSPEQVSVKDMCETLLGLISPQADRKQIELVLDVQKDMPIIITDPGKLQQILFNFLSNAVKFTPESGHVTLGARLDLGADVSGQDLVRIWVTDDGPGIPESQQSIIFEKFRQLDSSHTKEHPGTGLGLAISSELARLLQSNIDLESVEGEGATFSLIMPIELDIMEIEHPAERMDAEDTAVDLKAVSVSPESSAELGKL